VSLANRIGPSRRRSVKSGRIGAVGGGSDWGAIAVSDNSLSRIPFSVRDELMIASMARWMRFIAIINVVGGLVMAFLVLVGIIYFEAVLKAGPTAGPAAAAPTITVTANGARAEMSGEQLRRIISDNPVTFLGLGGFGLILAVVGTILGFVLYQAADDFDRVARSDVADQDYITAGIAQLTTYFKVSILLGVASVLVAIAAGIGLVAKGAIGS
jgi:hypothetical protein